MKHHMSPRPFQRAFFVVLVFAICSQALLAQPVFDALDGFTDDIQSKGVRAFGLLAIVFAGLAIAFGMHGAKGTVVGALVGVAVMAGAVSIFTYVT
jgi:hypothetical protein